jgi:hypothetical protein
LSLAADAQVVRQQHEVSMSRSASTIKALVAAELERAADANCRDRLAGVLVEEPTFLSLAWEYGAVDATRVCCVVARLDDGERALVYCEDGFGRQEPWGAVSLAEASMGSDDQWYGSLYDAAIGAGLCQPPPGYEVP